MDFTNLKRKQLQSLCKQHGIPANLTNLEMANRLTTLLKGNQQKRTKSCFRNFDNGVDDVDDENNKVESKEVKRVRFSPTNETFEFEKTDPRECRLLARKRRAMGKSEIESNPVVVSENVSIVDVGCVEKPIRRNLRRKSVVVLASQDVSNVEMVSKIDEDSVCENVGRNLRSRGTRTEEDEEGLRVFSTCVEKRGKRGRKGSRGVEEECVDEVDEMMVTRRKLRSSEVIVENLSKGDHGFVGVTENKKEVFDGKSENVLQVPRRSSRQIDKGKATRNGGLVGVSNQDAAKSEPQGPVEVALDNGRRKRGGKKTSAVKQQEVNEVSNGGVDKLNPDTKKPEESNAYVRRTRRGKEKVGKDLQEENGDVKVLEKKGQRRRNRIVEEDSGLKEMHVAKRSTRRAGLSKVDASLSEQMLDDVVPQSNGRVDEGEKEMAEIVNQESMPDSSGMEKVDDVGADHTSNKEPIAGGATLEDDSVRENKNSEVEERNPATGGVIFVEQKQAKCEGEMQLSVTSPLKLSMVDDTAKSDDYKKLKDGEDRTPEYIETNAQSPPKSESPAHSLLQDSDSIEAKSAVQTNNLEIPLKVHVASSMTSQEEIVCSEPVNNAKNCVDVAEPVCDFTEKPTIPSSSKVIDINGEISTIENSIGNKTLKTAAAAVLHKSVDHLIEQDGLSGSREICDNNFRKSERMTPEISRAQRMDQCCLDEEISSKANGQPSIVCNGLVSAFAASVATVHQQVDEGVDNKAVTPRQNLEGGSSCSNHKEPKKVESKNTDPIPSEVSPEPTAINISSLFAQSQVDEQNPATEGVIFVEQKQEKCVGDMQLSGTSPLNLSMVDDTAESDDYKDLKDSEDRTPEYVETNAQSPTKDESPVPSLLQDSYSIEAKSAVQTNNLEIPLKVHVASFMTSQEEIVCSEPVINTETFDGTILSTVAAENCVDVGEPVCGSTAKTTTPSSSKAIGINGERSTTENSMGNESLKTAAASIHKSVDPLIEQEGLSGSRGIFDNNLRESEHMTPEISSAQRMDQCCLDEKISSKANDQPSIVSDGLLSAFAASDATVHELVDEDVDNKTVTPRQNPVVGSSCSSYEESKEVESRNTDPSEVSPEPMTINIFSLFAQSQVDEQCREEEEKSEPGDVTELNCSSITKPNSPRSSKDNDINCEGINMKNAEGKKILDKSDDQQEEQEGTAGSREICHNIFRESECMETDISDAQRLHQCILDENIEPVSEASVKANVQPSALLDGSTPASLASAVAVHKTMEESVDTETVTPSQNLGVGSISCNNEQPKVVESQTTDISGSFTVSISSLFTESQVKEQCQANEDYILTEKKEEKSEETVQLFNGSSRHLNVACDTRNSEELTESNIAHKAFDDVETNADSPANKSLAPSLLQNGCDDDAKSSMKTSSALKVSTEFHVAAGNNCHKEIVSTPLSIGTRKFHGTPFTSVAPQHSIDTSKPICSSTASFTISKSSKVINYDDELSCQKLESGKGAKNSCQRSKDQLSKLDLGLEGAFAESEDANETKLLDNTAIFEKLGDQVVEQGEAPRTKESCDSISKVAERAMAEVVNSHELTQIGEPSAETSAQPPNPIAVDEFISLSEVSLDKPVEKVKTKIVKPLQSREVELRSINTEAHYMVKSQAKDHNEDMLGSLLNISTSWLYLHSQVDDELTVIQGSVKKGEESDKALRDLSCFDNTKLGYFIEDDDSLAVQQPENGQNFMDAKLQHSEFEDDMTNSDSKAVRSKKAAGITEENGNQGDYAVLLQDMSNEVPCETNNFLCHGDSFRNEANVFSPALSSKTEDLQASAVKGAEVLKDNVVIHVDYSTKSAQDKPENSLKDDHVSAGDKLMRGCSITANNSVAGSAVESAFGLEYWSETWKNTSEDKGSDTPQTACPANAKELYKSKYMLHEDCNKDVEESGDEVKSMEKVNLLFHKSTMVAETKPETSTNDISQSASDKNLIGVVSPWQMGFSAHCSSPLSNLCKDVDYEGVKAHCGEDPARTKDIIHPTMVETQLLSDDVKESDKSEEAVTVIDAPDTKCLPSPHSGKAWKGLAKEKESEANGSENAFEVVEVSDVTNFDSGKSNHSRAVMKFTGDEGDKIIEQPHITEAQNQCQMYSVQEAACMTGNEHLSSETPGDLRGSPRGVDEIATAPEHIDDGSNGILAFNENTEEVEADTDMQVNCSDEKGLDDDPVENGVESSAAGLVEAKEHSGGVAPDDHPFINMPENNEIFSDAIEDQHLYSVDNSVGSRNSVVLLGEGENGKVSSEECHQVCQISVEHLPNHCDVGTDSGSEGRDNTDELSNKAGSFSSWCSAFEDVANQYTSPSSASITVLHESEENNIEGCMFSRWELDLIYGEMAGEIDENEGANENDNPIKSQQLQGQLMQDQVSVLKVPTNSYEENLDRNHGKINRTATDETADTDENKVVTSSSMIKRNVNRSILIHGTPKKPTLFTHDMKENAPAAKTLQMVDVTAIKPIVKRKALGDLGK